MPKQIRHDQWDGHCTQVERQELLQMRKARTGGVTLMPDVLSDVGEHGKCDAEGECVRELNSGRGLGCCDTEDRRKQHRPTSVAQERGN